MNVFVWDRILEINFPQGSSQSDVPGGAEGTKIDFILGKWRNLNTSVGAQQPLTPTLLRPWLSLFNAGNKEIFRNSKILQFNEMNFFNKSVISQKKLVINKPLACVSFFKSIKFKKIFAISLLSRATNKTDTTKFVLMICKILVSPYLC